MKKEPSEFSFDELNVLMKNTGREQFDYRSFKAAYDSDARIKTMVKNFNQDSITLKTDTDADTTAPQQDLGNKAVSQMAKRATNKRK
ncbi:hypothetical protein N9D61_03835 [Planktomarina sp.]|nr:hypothetical protein [Planktomarina sp.]